MDIEYLDLYNLEIFCSIKKNINYNFNNVFELALILTQNTIQNIKFNLALTNNEDNFIKKIIKYKNVEINEGNIRVLFFELRDKELLKSIIIINSINFLNEQYVNKINKYLNFVDNLESIRFPISLDNLKDLGIKNEKYNICMQFAKNYFIEKKLMCTKDEILHVIKNFI